MSHAKLSPSAASRWLKCYASPTLEANHLDKQTVYSSEGIAAHSLGEIAIKTDTSPDRYIGQVIEGITVDLDMALAVSTYYQHVNQIRNQHKSVKVKLEKEVALEKDWFGTADCILFYNGILHVIDYKHGAGVKVAILDNAQLAFYGIAAMKAIGIRKIKKLILTIVQPRTGEYEAIKTWTIEDPKSFYEEWLSKFQKAKKRIEYVEELLKDKLSPYQVSKCYTSGEHCRFCKARAECPKLQSAMTALAKTDFDTEPGTSTYVRTHPAPNPQKLSPDQIAEILHKADLVEMYVKAVRERALELMLEGIDISGFKPVYNNTHRRWKDTKKVNAYLKKELGKKAFTERKLITPAQATKLIGKDFVQKNTTRPQGKPSIALNSDGRPAIRLAANIDFMG